MIAIVVAAAENNLIGKDNGLAWHLPADLRHFKQITLGHPILMGRKTYESIGKPLPGRTSIVITTQEDYEAPGCLVAHSLQEAVEQAKQLEEEMICIIGGAEIYRQALPLTDKIYLTRIHHTFEGDAYFPELKEENWVVSEQEYHEADEKNKYSFSFMTLEPKK